MESFLSKQNNNTYRLKVWVQPNAKKNSIEGVVEGFLKIKLKAPPVEGKANEELITFLSKVFNIKKRDIELKYGEKSRKKILIIRAKDLKPLKT